MDARHPLPIELPGTTQADPQPPGVDALLFFKPDRRGIFHGQLLVTSTDPERPELEIEVAGAGVANECPIPRTLTQDQEVSPLDVVVLDGSASVDPDGPNERPVAYEWVVVDRPLGSTTQPFERLYDDRSPARGGTPDVASTPTARFFVDLAGEYTLELRVTDHYGAQAPSALCPAAPARVHIKAVPSEALHIQLTWDTPGDPDQTDDQGTDVDLHLRHPRGARWSSTDGFDCFYQNRAPDWGQPGVRSDDPSLDIDDVNGAGPENINIAQPERTDAYPSGYLVGVHYFSADLFGGSGEQGALQSTARVRIFVNGEVAYEGERTLRETDDLWTVAEVRFNDATGQVIEVDELTSERP